MTTKIKVLIAAAIVFGCLLLAGGICTLSGVGMYNTEASLRNGYDMKVRANETVFDNMWKKIAQSSQVTDAQKNALKDIFTSYATARTGNGDGGSLMKWTQESVPNVDVSVYKNLQNIITGARDEWTANQVALIDLAREYNNNLSVFPSNIFLKFFGFEKIDPKIVTSTRTDNSFKTGKDDDTSLNLGK